MFGFFYFSAIGRIIVCVYRLYGLSVEPVSFIVFLFEFLFFSAENSILIIGAEILTTFYIHFLMISILGLYFERQLSTYYIADYERTTRKHISAVIIIIITTISAICTFGFIYETIQWYYTTTFAYISMCLGLLLFIKLYQTNMQKWNEVQNDHRRAKHAYSLSLRFQLEENIRALKLIKSGFSVLGFGCILNFFLFGFANSQFCFNLDGGYISQLSYSLCFLFVAITAVVIPIAALFSEPTYLRILQKMRFIGRLFTCYDIPSIQVSKTNDTTAYFANLSKQWNSC